MTDDAAAGADGRSFGRSLQRLVALTRKETRQLLRDPASMAIGVLLPILLILIFGYGLSLDVKNAPLAVVMEDSSPIAMDAVAGLQLTPYISPVMLGTMREAERLMRERKVDGIVRVPGDFSRRVASGDAQIQVLLYGVDSARAAIIQHYTVAALSQVAATRADRGGAAGPPASSAAGPVGTVVIEQRLWFNSANTSTWYLVPGLIVLIMTLVGAFLTAMVMAREWERGTLEALFVTPVRPQEILLAKIIPYFAIGMVGLALCLVAARTMFGVPLQGSLMVLIAIAMLYMLVAVAIGLLISTITRSQFVASQVALVTSFLPAMMLSGFLFDLRNVPWLVNIIGHVLPATHFMSAIRSLFLAGNVWPLVLASGALLAAYAVVLLGITRLITRKSLD